jgi:hypothetical protein
MAIALKNRPGIGIPIPNLEFRIDNYLIDVKCWVSNYFIHDSC